MSAIRKEKKMEKILFIDGEPWVSASLIRALRKRYQVKIALSGSAAIKKLRSRPYDLVLTEITIPIAVDAEIPDESLRGMQGRGLGIYILKQLRDGKFPSRRDIPVIVFTFESEISFQKPAKKVLRNKRRYFQKPRAFEVLNRFINGVMKREKRKNKHLKEGG
ncbi:MAG: response regulator [bacterium]